MTFYVFNLAITWYVIPDVMCYCIIVNVVFSDEDKSLIKNYISWRDIVRDSWGRNFRTKDGRKVVLTGCSRSSETGRVDRTSEKWQTAKCPHRWKHWPGDDMVLSQEDQPRTHSTVREISRGTGIPKSSVVRIIKKASAAEMLQEATYVRKSWLRRTGPLAWRVLRYLWRRFSSLL